MKMKLFSALSVISPVFSISCANVSNEEKLEKLVDKTYDFYPNKISTKEEKTQQNIEKIIKLVFGTDNVKKTAFLNTQNSEQHNQYMIQKLNEFKEKYKSNKTSFLKQQLEAYNKLMSDNWLWVFKNIGKFSLSFYEWLLYPDKGKGGSHSQKYKDYLSDLDYPEVDSESNYGKLFANNIIDEVIESEESAEISDVTILYIRKGSNIFRVRIDQINKKLSLDSYLWGFPRKQTSSSPSLRVVNSIAHAALVHGFEYGFKEFEQAYIEKLRYGAPAKLLMFWNGGDYEKSA